MSGATSFHQGDAMSKFHIPARGLEEKIQEWGRIQPLIDGSAVGSRSGFSMGRITYTKPHYSGRHDDHEFIYILEGRGTATINGEDIPFEEGSILIIPVHTEHQISEIKQGPVQAILVHVR
jgi:quercetin dioxygenase-like cupin family protein